MLLEGSTQRLTLAIRCVAVSMVSVLAFGTVAVAAQDADTSRPASIHTGTCDSPGDVVAELDALTVTFDDDDDDGSGSAAGGSMSTQTGDDNADDTGTGGDDNADDTNITLPTDDDNADDSGTGGGTTDDDADDGGTGDDINISNTGDDDDHFGGDDADDGGDDDGGGDDDADDNGSQLTGILAFQSSGNVDFVGAEDASVVEGSEDSDAGTNLEALLSEPHIVAVFESDGSDTIIACGSIGGFASADDNDLAIGLRAQNDSGFAGIAILDDDDDDDDLDVDVYIARDVAAGGGV